MFVLENQFPLPPTHKLFTDAPYLTECTAKVIYVQDDLLITDHTVFYAESGGQASDKGWINNLEVIDVQKQPGRVVYITRNDVEVPPVHVDTVVVHRLKEPVPFTVGQSVHMKIDWELRYKHMRCHSASHFVLHAIDTVYKEALGKLYLKGCYIYDKSARFDYGNKLLPELIPEVCDLANELITQGKRILMEPDSEIKDISYWTYGEIIIPCGGTHVLNATEVGPIRIKRKSHGKNLTRIYTYLEE